jgi:SnoaL-like polyketide cyclase
MNTITLTAERFLEACDTGQGWEGCGVFCTSEATFAAQAEPLVAIKTLPEYAEWMKGLLNFMPDGHFEVKSLATDEQRGSVCLWAVFYATHTAEGGPLPPTGKSTISDYVYAIRFDGDKICHVTKIWNAAWSMRELGWVE